MWQWLEMFYLLILFVLVSTAANTCRVSETHPFQSKTLATKNNKSLHFITESFRLISCSRNLKSILFLIATSFLISRFNLLRITSYMKSVTTRSCPSGRWSFGEGVRRIVHYMNTDQNWLFSDTRENILSATYLLIWQFWCFNITICGYVAVLQRRRSHDCWDYLLVMSWCSRWTTL